MSALNYGFLHENITLACFVSFGNRSSALGLLRTFGLYSILLGFSVSQEGHTSQHSNSLVAFRRPNIGRESSLNFFVKHTLQG